MLDSTRALLVANLLYGMLQDESVKGVLSTNQIEALEAVAEITAKLHWGSTSYQDVEEKLLMETTHAESFAGTVASIERLQEALASAFAWDSAIGGKGEFWRNLQHFLEGMREARAKKEAGENAELQPIEEDNESDTDFSYYVVVLGEGGFVTNHRDDDGQRTVSKKSENAAKFVTRPLAEIAARSFPGSTVKGMRK